MSSPRGVPLDDKHRERISAGLRRYHERRRRERRVMPRDLQELRANGAISPSVRPFVPDGEQEWRELIDQLGGPDRLSAAERILCEDVGRMGVVLRAEAARYAQSQDSDAASRVSALSSARRQAVALLGLRPRELQVPSLTDYLGTKRVEKVVEVDTASARNTDDGQVP